MMILNIISLISFIYKPTIYTLVFGEICFEISECFLSGSILYINKNIEDSTFRSTIFSVLSMEVNIISAIVMILSGILIDYRIEIEQAFVIFSLILGVIFILLKRRINYKLNEKII